jgi:ABC-type Co2+ transport system permease subunit
VPQTTAAGYLLAAAMTSLAAQKVSRVLADAWATWLNWRTTDSQLAAALGIPMPSVPLPPLFRPGFKPRPGGTKLRQGPRNGPQSPLCTA